MNPVNAALQLRFGGMSGNCHGTAVLTLLAAEANVTGRPSADASASIQPNSGFIFIRVLVLFVENPSFVQLTGVFWSISQPLHAGA